MEHLTNSELEIMETMWKMNRPLSRSEIIELTPNRTWKKSSIHILINKMLEKEVIKVDGFVRTNKNYGRTYAPLITKDDYIVSTFDKIKTSYSDSKSSAVTSIFAALIQDEDINDELLDELQQMIERRKQKKK
ncbi:BlaI/MecI/CopY family transcriptional regulator [Lachnospiraceae bacterium 66-29]